TRSRDSRQAVSGRPTTLNAGSPLETWTSTATGRPSTPSSVAEGTMASTAQLLGEATSRRAGRRPLERWAETYSGGVTITLARRSPAIIRGVGFNPFRQQQRRSTDYVFVAAAALVVLALLVWAAFL